MSLSYLTADAELVIDGFDAGIDTSELEDYFATQPEMPAYEQLNEEELHTSFEAAISNRVCILHKQLSLKSSPLTQIDAQHTQPQTEPLGHSNSLVHRAFVPGLPQPQGTFSSSLFSNVWQRTVVFVCAALMFMLLGFDMMGLLVLHAH